MVGYLKRIRKDIILIEKVKLWKSKNNQKIINISKYVPQGTYDIILIPK